MSRAKRPKTVAECPDGVCPWVGCRYHLYLTVSHTGKIRVNHPGKDVDEIGETCALRAAAQGGTGLLEIGAALGITKERVRQIEAEAFAKMRTRLEASGVTEDDVLEVLASRPDADPYESRRPATFEFGDRLISDISAGIDRYEERKRDAAE